MSCAAASTSGIEALEGPEAGGAGGDDGLDAGRCPLLEVGLGGRLEVVAVAHVVRLAAAAAFIAVDGEVQAALGQHPRGRLHDVAQGRVERIETTGMEEDVGLGHGVGTGRRAGSRQLLEAQSFGPVGPLGLRGAGHVAGVAQLGDDTRVGRRDDALLVQVVPELPGAVEDPHVVAAYLAADVAVAAEGAFVDDVHQFVGDLAAPVGERQQRDHAAAAGIRVEVPVVDARASLGELVARDPVLRDPFAVRAAVTPHRYRSIIFKCHRGYSSSPDLRSKACWG